MSVNNYIKVKRLTPTAIIPTKGSFYSAGYDLYADVPEAVSIAPGKTKKIGTGVAITPPAGTFGAIFARSGLAAKEGLRPANCVGVADFDYTGEYVVALHNDSYITRTVNCGDRIAQVVFIPYISKDILEVEELDETDRGDGGFGSTGK